MTRRQSYWLIAIAVVVAVRVATLDAYALADTTEARYSEIARLMVTSNDWIVPQIEAGVPFWGKPPLSIWLTALSIKLLGPGEFAARLPALLLAIATAWLTCATATVVSSRLSGIIASAVFLTSAIGFVVAGAVMTDAALLLSTTICLYAFAGIIKGTNSPHPLWFFVGLGLGLLAKGPVAVVLVMLPVAAWATYYKRIPWLFHSLPWWRGTLVALAIAVPWYALAEAQSPGFLQYFLVGEHWHRFLDSGWSGDLYGHAHAEAKGTIWLFGIAAALPWSIIAIFATGDKLWRRESRVPLNPATGLMLAWALSPLVIFTFAGNILPSYVLPGLPAFSILLASWMAPRSPGFATAGLLVPILAAGVFLLAPPQILSMKSERDLVTFHAQTMPGKPLYYYGKIPYSAGFYSGGSAKSLRDQHQLQAILSSDADVAIAIKNSRLSREPNTVAGCLQLVQGFPKFSLFRKPATRCTLNSPE